MRKGTSVSSLLSLTHSNCKISSRNKQGSHSFDWGQFIFSIYICKQGGAF